jgi:excisionase family DNA binding protein
VQQQPLEPTWLTYRDAEQLVGLSRWTLLRLSDRGQIKTVRVGRAVRINRNSLEEYLERRADSV